MRTCSISEIQKILHVTKMQVMHWTQTGAVRPFKNDRGRGKRRLYDEQNLAELAICRELNRLLVPPTVMKDLLGMLREPRCLVKQKEDETVIFLGFNDGRPEFDGQMGLLRKCPSNCERMSYWQFLKLMPETGFTYFVFQYMGKNFHISVCDLKGAQDAIEEPRGRIFLMINLSEVKKGSGLDPADRAI